MWLLAGILYIISKCISWSVRKRGSAPTWMHLAYLLAWPGMDADTFLYESKADNLRLPSVGEWLFAFGKTLFGLGLIIFVTPQLPNVSPYVNGWINLLGMIMLLHFGLFHLLSCYWRSRGIAAKPIMNWPILATSLSEFWGQRWNLAFRDLTHRFVFRPLAKRFGIMGALLIGFFVSGLIHDVVISIPAGGGYGLPTCYFLLQGIGIFVEKSRAGNFIGIRHGFRGRCFSTLFLLLPISLLFHHQFVVEVIVPFFIALRKVL